MFSFHKPKIYRSNLGCCICKAKSSSSRFTDSKKYENEFERCFKIQEKRSGEICNACVLLVKRWKKLSPENRLVKHWHHVVDARAGPGTKLTSNRRLTGAGGGSGRQHLTSKQASSPSAIANESSSDSSSSSSSNSISAHSSHHHQHHSLPLGSNQSSNQTIAQSKCSGQNNAQQATASSSSSGAASVSGATSQQPVRRRGGSFSNKGRAIDTNVSTFTFGESSRRSYMTAESFSASASSLAKPQSALNSSAFESVIKRFRQRQQQQLLEAQRRQLNKQQRHQRLVGQLTTAKRKLSNAGASNKKQLPVQQQQQELLEQASDKLRTNEDQALLVSTTACDQQQKEAQLERVAGQQQQVAQKRVKRSSESIGSICVDGLRVSSLLDSSLWRKEKVCCGIIFRGLYNEVAIFPKILKPCQCRLQKRASGSASIATTAAPAANELPSAQSSRRHKTSGDNNAGDELLTRQMLEANCPSPPPRAQKSGSISSCDSNTSGTGSMEEPILDEELLAKETASSTSEENPSSGHYQEESLKFIYI